MVYLFHTQNRGCMDRTYRKQTEHIKQKIVDGYRRGVCNADGGHIPVEKRGRVGKGSHFGPRRSPAFRRNFDLIDWSHW